MLHAFLEWALELVQKWDIIIAQIINIIFCVKLAEITLISELSVVMTMINVLMIMFL